MNRERRAALRSAAYVRLGTKVSPGIYPHELLELLDAEARVRGRLEALASAENEAELRWMLGEWLTELDKEAV